MSEVLNDEVVEFFQDKFTSKAGKPVTINKMTLKKFGPVSLGFTKPETLPFVEGDNVAIKVTKNYGEWQYKGEADPGDVPTLATPPASAPRGGAPGGKPAFAMVPKVFPVPQTHGDMAIIHQNSLTNAIKFHELQMMASPDEAPSVEQVLETAYRFADFSSGADLTKKDE